MGDKQNDGWTISDRWIGTAVGGTMGFLFLAVDGPIFAIVGVLAGAAVGGVIDALRYRMEG